MICRPDTYRISRQQKVILGTLYERQHKLGERIDYWELKEMIVLKLNLNRVTKHVISSLGRSIRNLLDKSWICAYSHDVGRGRGYYVQMFDIKITACGISALKSRAVR